MLPDVTFLLAGFAVLLIACGLTYRTVRSGGKPEWLASGLWAALSAGLLVQAFSPHLQLAKNGFLLPADILLRHPHLNPEDLIRRQREMMTLSSVLVVGACLGLAFHYRALFVRTPAPPG